MKIPNPRSKPPAENHREKGRDDVQVREKGDRGGGGGGGAAREGGDHNRARLRQHPHPRSLPPLLAALPPSVPTRRCVAWGARRERRGGDGTATSGKQGCRHSGGWPVDGAGSPVPDPHGHTGPSRESPRSGAVRRAIDGVDGPRSVVRGVGPTSCASDRCKWPEPRVPKGVRCTAGPVRTTKVSQ